MALEKWKRWTNNSNTMSEKLPVLIGAVFMILICLSGIVVAVRMLVEEFSK